MDQNLEERIPSPVTSQESKTIKPIDKITVHRICSGQVVLNLAIAVKELVENAIDAGATVLEIRLKEYGSELIEVIDNGSGVEEMNFEALTLKHHTSKIRQFSDLSFVSTLGFRGEALSSLCALADICITTKHSSAECGTKIEYDHKGHIKNKIPCARQTGTTVTLSNLFSTLPVRRKDFTKNLKREFSKMLELLYAYCIISNIRFICTNQTKKTPRIVVVQTQGGKTLKENIISVFGSKQTDTLIEFQLHRPTDEILEEFAVKLLPQELLPFQFKGYISKCTHTFGRSTADRQFYYINSRPCVPNKLIKLVNEIYRSFNGNQYPFVVLDILIEQKLVDVNVTPDKRQVFMENEKLLLATAKTSLLEIFKEFPSTFQMQNVIMKSKKDIEHEERPACLEMFKHYSQKNQETLNTPKSHGVKRKNCSSNSSKIFDNQAKGILNCIFEKRQKINEDDEKTFSDSGSDDEPTQLKKFVQESYDSEDSDVDLFNASTQQIDKVLIENLTDLAKQNEKSNEKICNETVACDQTYFKEENIMNVDRTENFFVSENEDDKNSKEYKICYDEYLNSTVEDSKRSNFICKTSFKDIEEKMQKILSVKSASDETLVRFRSELTCELAEKELQKNISKDMFGKMEIIGQFNKGFIITKLGSDLFIIDQHASDEKYNFETLQRNTVLENQKLVSPLPLDLTAANENLLIDNLYIFTKNGFVFNIDENAPPRKKVSLTAIPMSKNYQFGKEDIDELLFILQEDSTSTMLRPSRIRSMFASRACRKSVMIGSALSKNDMRKLIDHMGQIDQPWNCPHGRPTMRHLINLNLIQE